MKTAEWRQHAARKIVPCWRHFGLLHPTSNSRPSTQEVIANKWLAAMALNKFNFMGAEAFIQK